MDTWWSALVLWVLLAVLDGGGGRPMALVPSARRIGRDRGDVPRALVEGVPAGAVSAFATEKLEIAGGNL